VVREGETIARLESIDYEASGAPRRGRGPARRGDLAEYVRQLRLSEDLTAQKIVAVDQRDAAASRVKIARRRSPRRRPTRVRRGAAPEHVHRAPFGGVV